MSPIGKAIAAAERAPIPVVLALQGVDWLCARTARRLAERRRLLFLTTARLFGHAGGGEGTVGHYRLSASMS